jgi:poly [ADP-ribose] polymerase
MNRFTEKPTEEEEAVMDAESMAAKGKSGGDEALEAELMTKAEALEWILDDKQGMKKATQDLIELCNGKVDLPETNTTMEVGKIVAANRSLQAKQVLKLVIDQFGFSLQNEEATMKKNAAIATMCEHPANAEIVKAFLELGGLYAAEHNHNAASSYKKVANAIRKLDFEITEKNAKGLGGGKKTKVDGIGKSSADKIYEFITRGNIAKLEEKRAVAS